MRGQLPLYGQRHAHGRRKVGWYVRELRLPLAELCDEAVVGFPFLLEQGQAVDWWGNCGPGCVDPGARGRGDAAREVTVSDDLRAKREYRLERRVRLLGDRTSGGLRHVGCH